MDWTGEMTESFYRAPRSGAIAPSAGTVASGGGPSDGAQTGPHICKAKRLYRYVTNPVTGTARMSAWQIQCYQPVAFDDIIWPPGVDETQNLGALDVLSVTNENLLGDDTQTLYLVMV